MTKGYLVNTHVLKMIAYIEELSHMNMLGSTLPKLLNMIKNVEIHLNKEKKLNSSSLIF